MEIQAEAQLWVWALEVQAPKQKLLFSGLHGQRDEYALINEGERPKK